MSKASFERAFRGRTAQSSPGRARRSWFVGFTTSLQRRTPRPLTGRVSLAAETLTSGPRTVSIAAPLVSRAAGYRSRPGCRAPRRTR
ncbi:hypothetical protein, partial [Actinoallomurus acaciae]